MTELYDAADESFSRGRPGWAKGMIRYITGQGKAIDKAEYDSLLAAGYSVALVQEGGNQPAMRGWAGGVADAQAANNAADQIGFPPDRPIYYVAEDPNPLAQGAWPTVVSYFQGVASLHRRPAGGYGSRGLLEHLHDAGLIGFVWQVKTWGPGISPLANLVQNPNPDENTLGGSVDEDDVLTADWGQHPSPAIPPPPEDPDMTTRIIFYAAVADGQAAFLSDGTWFRWIGDPEVTDAPGVLAELGNKVVYHEPRTPVADVKAFGRPQDKATADLVVLPFP